MHQILLTLFNGVRIVEDDLGHFMSVWHDKPLRGRNHAQTFDSGGA